MPREANLAGSRPARAGFSGARRAGVWTAALAVFEFALLPASPALAAQATPALPHAEQIIQKALARAKWADEQKLDAQYTYMQRGTLEELDSRENVKRHEERLSQVLPIDGQPYARLVQKDGRPLTEKEVRAERDHEQKFRQNLAEKKRKRAEGKKNENDIEFNEELASRYNFQVTGSEAVNGRPAFVLAFEPRSPDLPVKRKLDRLFNKLAGRMWIDERDYEIARLDVHLAENVSAWGGMLASVRKFFVRMEQCKVDEVAWFPASVDGYIDGRILIKALHLKIQQQNSGFRRMDAGTSQPTTGRE